MSLSDSDYEEYLVRKILDAGYVNPKIADCSRVRFLLDFNESIVTPYLEEKRGFESQEQYDAVLSLIDAIKNEVPE